MILIDGNKLKEIISEKIPRKFGRWDRTIPVCEWETFIRDIIDNAPTVELCYQTTSCLDCKNYDKENYYCPRFCEVIREATEEIKRPKGEWIDYNNTFYKCPDCGYLLEKCCPHCQNKVILPKGGADMRGDKSG